MKQSWMIYGANGYTGRLLVARAAARGEQPIIAGRNVAQLRSLAREFGGEVRAFALDDPAAIRGALSDVSAVVHCAGPYAHTAAPMVDACLATQTHYLDITGEVDVFEAIALRHADAVQAGVVLLPGVGFDVVPSDCLAAAVAARLPTATELDIAFTGIRTASAGTMRTTVEGLMAARGYVRRGGLILTTREGRYCKTVPFVSRTLHVTSISWGDVSTALRSTGIGDITVYMALPRLVAWLMVAAPLVTKLLRSRSMRAWIDRAVTRFVAGPSLAERRAQRIELWAEVRDAQGRRQSGTMSTPNAYDFTTDAALTAVLRVRAGEVAPGVHTPSTAFGATFATGLEGVVMQLR